MPRNKMFFNQKKQIRENLEQGDFVLSPKDALFCGKLLSIKAKVIYELIYHFNPSFPSLSQLETWSGLRREAVVNAIEELVVKRVCRKKSGKKQRIVNVYESCDRAHWQLQNNVISPSEKHKKRKETVRLSNQTSSIIELANGSIIEHQRTQTVTNLNNELSDAQRQMCPTDRSDGERREGKDVRLSADDINAAPKGAARIDAYLEWIKQAREEGSVGKEREQFPYPQENFENRAFTKEECDAPN